MDSEDFSKELSEALLGQQWLVKIDSSASVPYLFKVTIDEHSKCNVLITDTKSVWTEILTSMHTVRRWRACNPNVLISSDEDAFRCLQKLLQSAHSPSSISEASFEVVETTDADLAFELDFDSFKWRWETYRLGPKTSAEVLSRHLILPLITLSHLSFNSADPVSELEEAELEKVVDKTGKSARRSTDIHVRQTLGRPRIATTLQRISSMFGFVDPLPSIESEPIDVDMKPHLDALKALNTSTDSSSYPLQASSTKLLDLSSDDARMPSPQHMKSPIGIDNDRARIATPSPLPLNSESTKEPAKDSETDTESENDVEMPPQTSKSQNPITSGKYDDPIRDASAEPAEESQARSQSQTSSVPAKKRKTPDSGSDSDSDGSKDRGGKGKAGPRGVRQPFRRGKKF